MYFKQRKIILDQKGTEGSGLAVLAAGGLVTRQKLKAAVLAVLAGGGLVTGHGN
jgi:hypothetical protein